MSLTASSLLNTVGRLCSGAEPGSTVLHVCSDYPGSPVFHELIANLSREQQSRTAVYVPLRKTHEFLGQHRYEPDSAPVLYSKDYREFDRLFYHRKCSKILEGIRRQVELSGVGLVHAHYLFAAGGVAYGLKREFGIPYVVAVRNSDVNVYFRFARHLREAGVQILRNAERVFFLSPAYQDKTAYRYLPKHERDALLAKSLVIPSGINDFWFGNRLTSSRHFPRSPLKLLYVGELTKNKNLESTIAATAMLNSRGIPVELTIVGTGSHENQIAAIASRHKGLVNLRGWVTGWQERLAVYRNADVFVMPSFKETFGLVYFEAMSQGLPVIYSRGEGIDGYFEQGRVGYACNPSNVTEIADRIQDIQANYSKMSDAARGAVDICQWRSVAGQYEDIYRSLIAARTHRRLHTMSSQL